MTRWLLAITALAAASCGSPNIEDWTVHVEPLASPAGPQSSEPQLAVSGAGVLLSWIERAGDTVVLKFAERSRSGWTQPTTAASGDDWFLSYADVPSVMRKRNGTLVAQWLQSTEARFEGYDLVLSYSTNNGKTWAPSFAPHNDGTKFQHGFASFFELPADGLGVIWLDGRNSEFFEHDPQSGTMTLRYATYDSRWNKALEGEIDHNVCECCSTAAAVTDDGVLAAYRNRTDAEIRDIAVSRLENGRWTSENIVHGDNWELYSCPVNGPGLAARGRQAVVTWFTVKNDQGQAYGAFSEDAGQTWGAPIRLDEGGALGRVDVELLDNGTAVASWVEYRKEGSELRIRLIDPSGGRSASVIVAKVGGGNTSGFPRMARDGDELVFAWTAIAAGGAPDASQVFTARAELP